MSKFTDADGREWSLRLTVGHLAKVRTDAGVDLGKAVAHPDTLGAVLFDDREALGRVLWALVEPQAERVGVSPEQFGYALDGEASRAATAALVEAVVDFFQSARASRATGAALRAAWDRADRAAEAAADSIWNPPAGSTPGSSGLTPAG